MNALIYTNEYPPCNYGGAGVHVEYLTSGNISVNNSDVLKFPAPIVKLFSDSIESTVVLKVCSVSYTHLTLPTKA